MVRNSRERLDIYLQFGGSAIEKAGSAYKELSVFIFGRSIGDISQPFLDVVEAFRECNYSPPWLFARKKKNVS